MAELTEIEFYDRLAEFFDIITDWRSRLAVEMPFLQATLNAHQAQAVLDCACGTGWHAIALAGNGYRVAASDVSAEMISRAAANARHEGVAIPFSVARFQNLPTTFRPEFDAVLCLGNSFPHVLTEEGALASLAGMRACLRERGVLVLHDLNYDKRLKERPRWFGVNSGVLDGRETLVWRFADYGGTPGPLITFNIAIFSRGDDGAWSVKVQSTLQRPYQKAEIEGLLSRAGFRDLEFYGSLAGEGFDAERSGDLVIVAVA